MTVQIRSFAPSLAVGLLALANSCQQPPGEPPASTPTNAATQERRDTESDRPAADPTAATSLPDLPPRQRDARGDELLKAGRFREALSDFDAYLAAFPNAGPYHWRRGIACYYANAFAQGVAQFESHRVVNPDDVENAAWHFLCKARLDGIDAARAAILPVGPDGRAPLPEVYALYAGTGTIEAVEARMAAANSLSARFYGHLYLGLYQEALGDLDAARTHLRQAAGPDRIPHYMGDVAAVHLRTLSKR